MVPLIILPQGHFLAKEKLDLGDRMYFTNLRLAIIFLTNVLFNTP
jgi:hypothetical protein